MNNFYDVNQNLLTRALKNQFLPSFVFFCNRYVSFYMEQPSNFLLSFLSQVLYSTLIDWLMFKGDEFDCLLEFHIAHSEILSKACADQLLYDLSLIKYVQYAQ